MVKRWMICRSLDARRCFWRMDHHCWMIGDLIIDISLKFLNHNEVEWLNGNWMVTCNLLDVFFFKGNCVAMRNHRFFTLMVDISAACCPPSRRWSIRHQGAIRLPGMGNSFREDSLGCLRPGHVTHITNKSAVYWDFLHSNKSQYFIKSISYQLSFLNAVSELVTIAATGPGISKTYAGISMVRHCASAVFSPLAGVNGELWAGTWSTPLRFGQYWVCPSWCPSRALSYNWAGETPKNGV